MAPGRAPDGCGEPFLDLLAERDYAEAEGELPDHELEHALEVRREDGLPPDAGAAFAKAAAEGLDVELVALDPGEEPDWPESVRYVDSLIFEESRTTCSSSAASTSTMTRARPG